MARQAVFDLEDYPNIDPHPLTIRIPRAPRLLSLEEGFQQALRASRPRLMKDVLAEPQGIMEARRRDMYHTFTLADPDRLLYQECL
jgi:hypothetical protein